MAFTDSVHHPVKSMDTRGECQVFRPRAVQGEVRRARENFFPWNGDDHAAARQRPDGSQALSAAAPDGGGAAQAEGNVRADFARHAGQECGAGRKILAEEPSGRGQECRGIGAGAAQTRTGWDAFSQDDGERAAACRGESTPQKFPCSVDGVPPVRGNSRAGDIKSQACAACRVVPDAQPVVEGNRLKESEDRMISVRGGWADPQGQIDLGEGPDCDFGGGQGPTPTPRVLSLSSTVRLLVFSRDRR